MTVIPLALALAIPQPQAPVPDVRALFEAGGYQRVVEAVGRVTVPTAAQLYLGALSHQELGNTTAAAAWIARLSALPEKDPWHFIGLSALALAEGRAAEALRPAATAVERAPGLTLASFQQGLALAANQEFAAAAAAFERVVGADPGSAYAHYYAGLAYSRVKRIDKMAAHFEAFMRLAPAAPERSQVASIMRTVRGR